MTKFLGSRGLQSASRKRARKLNFTLLHGKFGKENLYLGAFGASTNKGLWSQSLNSFCCMQMVSDMSVITRWSLAIMVAVCILPSGENSFVFVTIVYIATYCSVISSLSVGKHPRNEQVKTICWFSVSYEQHFEEIPASDVSHAQKPLFNLQSSVTCPVVRRFVPILCMI